MLRVISGNFARQILVGLTQLGLMVLISHRFGPEGVGAYTLSVLVPILGAQMMTFGLQSASVYLGAHGRFGIGAILRANLIATVVISTLFVALALPVVLIFGARLFADLPQAALLWGLAAFPAYFAITVLPALAQAERAFRAYNLFLLIQPLAQLAMAAVIVPAGGSETALVASFAVSSWLAALSMALWMGRRWGLGPPETRDLLRAAWGYGMLSHLGNIVGLLNYRAVVWVAANLLGVGASGLYVLAMQPAEKLWLPSQAAATVLFPVLARTHAEPQSGMQRAADLAGRMARAILLVTAALALGAALLAAPLMVLLFGDRAAAAVTPFLILLPGIVAWAPSRILAHDIAACGAVRYNLWNAVITLTVNLVLLVPLILALGVAGAALATTLAYCADLGVRAAFHARLTGTRPFAWMVPRRDDYERLRALIRHRGDAALAMSCWSPPSSPFPASRGQTVSSPSPGFWRAGIG